MNKPCALYLVCNADEGRDASWNEKFKFQINSTSANAQHKLIFRIMDHDNMSSDDFLGQAT
jgi:Ca2+-dependent lipid-binding protein